MIIWTLWTCTFVVLKFCVFADFMYHDNLDDTCNSAGQLNND